MADAGLVGRRDVSQQRSRDLAAVTQRIDRTNKPAIRNAIAQFHGRPGGHDYDGGDACYQLRRVWTVRWRSRRVCVCGDDD